MATIADIEAFKAWLSDQGAVLAEPTNEWELLRYKLAGATHIVWSKKNGALTWSPDAQRHQTAFRAGERIETVKRVGGIRRMQLVKELLRRDGRDCWLCGKPLGDDITVEHFLAVARGGTNNPANACLTHQSCNQKMADLPIVAKVRMREEMRT